MSRNFSVRGRKKYVKHASGSHAKKERRLYDAGTRQTTSVCPVGNIRYGIRGCEERVIGHDDRHSPQEHEFSSDFARRKCGELYTCAAATDALASLERGKFTVLAIKCSLSHYVDLQPAVCVRRSRRLRLSVRSLSFNYEP